jgi:Protein-glutamine gamma-glutamyltransferase
VTASHHKPYPPHHPDCHPNAPAFHAGAGCFRMPRVLGSDLGDDSHIHHDAPAARHLVWGRIPEHHRRTTKVRPQQKSHLVLLKEGANLLAHVRFGHALKENHEQWDKVWWDKRFYIPPGESEKELVLLLKENKSPADAVLRIFNNVNDWSFDCAQFVQVVLLYAVVKKLGKKSFDHRVASHKPTQGRLVLRAHGSTGLTYKGGWEHSKEDLQSMNTERATAVMKEQENKFKSVANGSQIVFTNLDPRSNDKVYEHENTIKVGSDLFIAHGIKPGIKVVTREQIYEVLARDAVKGTGQAPDDAYKKKNLYISTIVLYGDN